MFDFNPAHWEYCAEGALNIALRYVGDYPELTGKILRLRKHLPASASSSSFSKEATLEECYEFVENIMVPILGREFCAPTSLIRFPHQVDFLPQLARRIEESRPGHRRRANALDLESRCGLVMRDYAKICQCGACENVCFEIKPKWGFLCKEPSKFSCKQNVDRFTMHQHLRGRSSKYSPLDLFSSDEARMLAALQALSIDPQNNLKLFINGKQQQLEENAGRYFTDEYFTRIIKVLRETRVLQAILAAQTLGPLDDIESVYPLYQSVQTVIGNPKQLPRLAPDMTAEEIVHRFIISCTTRDCSIMITFCQHCNAEAAAENEQYLLGIVDLDAKPVSKMHHYFTLDQEIAAAYSRSHSVE